MGSFSITTGPRCLGNLAMSAATDMPQKNPPIEFYFDLSSPYSYLGAKQVVEVAAKHRRQVKWYPILLGVIFKTTENRSLMEQPLKADYMTHDVSRIARRMAIPYQPPAVFPFPSQVGARAIYWAATQGPEAAQNLSLALFDAIYADGGDIREAKAVATIATTCQLDGAALLVALETPEIKNQLRQAVSDAVAKQVCGVPFFIVDDEPFWGSDRLHHLDQWLASGGW
jgi:2-hydroxychromene-2-carboxylate isomerase